MKESEIEEIFQKSLAVAFYDAIENEPAVISLIFKSESEGEKGYNYLKENLTKDEVCLILNPGIEEKMSITFIDKKNSKVYNIKNIIYQEPNFEGFKINYKEKYAVFLTMFIGNGKMIVSSECQFPIIVNEVIFGKADI